MISRDIQKVPEGKNELRVFLRKILREHYKDIRDIYMGGAILEKVVALEGGTLSNDPSGNKALAGVRVKNSDDSHYIAIDANQIEQVGNMLYLNFGSDTNLSMVNGGGSAVIGGTIPTTDAKLDVVSTTGAFMPPRMTTTQRDALTPSEGMMIYNTTTKQFEGYEDAAWVDL